MTFAPALGLRTVHTREVDDPGALLALAPTDEVVTWLHDGEGLVGWGEHDRLVVTGPDRFAEAEGWWQAVLADLLVDDEVTLPGTGPVCFGSFAFDEREPSVLVVPRVVVGRSAGRCWVSTLDGDERDHVAVRAPEAPGPVRFADGARKSADWSAVVASAVGRIGAGALDKVVLARDLEACTEAPIDLRWPLARLAERYPDCRTFAVDGLIGATPEILVRLVGDRATSRVLAGTFRRTGDPAGDAAEAEALSRSSKDLEEHEYAVRSVADALAEHSRAVQVPDAPFVLHLPNVMHLATDVRARVDRASTVLSIVDSLHPSAAVCGTPTDRAGQLIAELEGMSRGRYAGPVGWVDARGDGEWGIALRCGERDPHDLRRMRLFAGCGIVAGSVPADELAESVAKLVPMRDALQG